MQQHYFLNALDLKKEWFKDAVEGNLDNMKHIYNIMEENGYEKDIKKWRAYGNCTTLMVATMYGRQNVVRWLLHEFQFDVNEKNCYGNTALHVAVIYNQMECAILLLDQGSRLLENKDFSTPLDHATSEGKKEMQNLLESHFHSD